MSFVQKLRMNNIFPTGGMNLGFSGQLPRYGGSDPMRDIVDNYAVPRSMPQPRQPAPASTGALNRIAGRMAEPEQPLRFGGVVGHDSNPGADILRRASANAERIYAGYSEPQVTAGEILGRAGIKQNDQDPGMTAAIQGLDMDKQLNRDAKQAQIDSDKARTKEILNRENLTEDKAWKVITITDPNDPTKQINARYNTISNKVEPIDLPNGGIITNTTRQADMVKQKEAEAAKTEASRAFKERAQLALDTLNELSTVDEAGNEVLKPDTQTATGWSANIPGLELIPGMGPGVAGARASVDRLKNLLTLDLLQEIKKQSKTGATGFGQMNLRELGVLENSASKLSKMNQSEPGYATELNNIRKKLTEILSQEGGFTGPQGAVGTEDGVPANTPPAGKVSATQPPAPVEGWDWVLNAAGNGWTARPKGSK